MLRLEIPSSLSLILGSGASQVCILSSHVASVMVVACLMMVVAILVIIPESPTDMVIIIIDTRMGKLPKNPRIG